MSILCRVPDPVVCDPTAGTLADGGRLLQYWAGRGQRVDEYLASVAENRTPLLSHISDKKK